MIKKEDFGWTEPGAGGEGGWGLLPDGEEMYYAALEKSQQKRLYDEDYLEDFYHISQELAEVGGDSPEDNLDRLTLSKELTDSFQKKFAGRLWDGDYLDEIENHVKIYLDEN